MVTKYKLKTGDKINIINNAPLSYRTKPLDEATVYIVTDSDIKVMAENEMVQFKGGKIQPFARKPKAVE